MRISDWSSDVCSSDLRDRDIVTIARLIGRVPRYAAIEDIGAASFGPVATRHIAVNEAHQRRDAIDDGGIDHLALARSRGLKQAADQTESQIHRAAAKIADQVERWWWRAAFGADRIQRAGQRYIIEVVPRRGGQRTFLTPAGHAAIDQLRVDRMAGFRPEAEALHHARPVSLNQAVRMSEQPANHLDAGRLLQVDHKGTTASVGNAVTRIAPDAEVAGFRSEEHTSEPQSLMRI